MVLIVVKSLHVCPADSCSTLAGRRDMEQTLPERAFRSRLKVDAGGREPEFGMTRFGTVPIRLWAPTESQPMVGRQGPIAHRDVMTGPQRVAQEE
ncbi:hypothetical protein [Sphingobium sp. OAS761]|uniref:hypothetical protein n=1 Tax=Sphingobium sp. OAS761 TaxID=2817901 RepID=UPI0020A0F5EE|nr:hypothetical protein [Sphingobium sp. OAS761]